MFVENFFLYFNQTFIQYQTTIFVLSGVVFAGWLFNRYWINRPFHLKKINLHGKIVLITGGNTGIGYETAKDLLQRDAHVIIACRNLIKGNEAIENLINETKCKRKQIELMELNLCSFESIRNFVKLFDNKQDKLDILICNAGLGYSINEFTEDGFNYVIQANYLGHFLLTNLLLKKLKKSKHSRIINVSSDLHRSVKSIDWSDIFIQKNKSRLMGAYAPSKFFQILSTFQLKQNLFDEEIDVFSLTPGLVSTSIKDPMEESIGPLTSIIYYPFTFIMKYLFSKTPKNGAQTTIYCAIEPSLIKSNEIYFRNCIPCKPSPLTIHPTSAQTLWTLSLQAVQL